MCESRSQAENEKKHDWDIVAEIRGSIPVSDGKVQFLGQKEVGMNYQQVSQTTYNTNATVAADQQTLGATGAFSYTEFDISLINYHTFKEDGYIHIIAQTSADTIFETGIDRHDLNVTWDSEYRPDFDNLKEDTLLKTEQTGLDPDTTKGLVIGFKRKFSEYFKLPNIVNGDITSTPMWDLNDNMSIGNPIPLKKEFQFFEVSTDYHYHETTGTLINKNIWQDYTDLLINKNLAIRETIKEALIDNRQVTYVTGANQIFMVAKAICITNQPINENIKADFKKWGEA